jgi:hypothetical protein
MKRSGLLEKKVADEVDKERAYKRGENIWKCARYKPAEIALSLVPDNAKIWVCVSSCPYGPEEEIFLRVPAPANSKQYKAS